MKFPERLPRQREFFRRRFRRNDACPIHASLIAQTGRRFNPRKVFSDWPQPRGESARENGDENLGNVSHCTLSGQLSSSVKSLLRLPLIRN